VSAPKHTPEPWRIDGPLTDAGHVLIVDPHGDALARLDAETVHLETVNAARIVACVNAFAGIDDPAAFVAAHRELVEAARGIIQAINRAVEPLDFEVQIADRRLRAALAKVGK
jgi:hypothetical protein